MLVDMFGVPVKGYVLLNLNELKIHEGSEQNAREMGETLCLQFCALHVRFGARFCVLST